MQRCLAAWRPAACRPAPRPFRPSFALPSPSLRPQRARNYVSGVAKTKDDDSKAVSSATKLPDLDQALQLLSHGKRSQAVEPLKRSIEILAANFGDDHEDVILARKLLARALIDTEQYIPALYTLPQLKHYYPQDHDVMRRVSHDIVLANMKLGKFENARDCAHSWLCRLEDEISGLVTEPASKDDMMTPLRVESVDAHLLHAMNCAYLMDTSAALSSLYRATSHANNIAQPHLAQAKCMYYTVILKHRASPDKAEEYLKKAVETIELVPNKAHKAAQLLLSQIYDELALAELKRENFAAAENYTKQSLDITNKLLPRESKRVEWTLHLAAHALAGEKKFMYAEGLLKRLRDTAEKDVQAGKALSEIQIRSLKKLSEIAIKFGRESEAKEINRLIAAAKETDLVSDLHFTINFFDFTI